MTIRLLILNLNSVVTLFSQSLQDIDAMEKGPFDVGLLEKKSKHASPPPGQSPRR